MKSLPRAWGRRALTAFGVWPASGLRLAAFGLFLTLLAFAADPPPAPRNLRLVSVVGTTRAAITNTSPDTVRLAGTVVDAAGLSLGGVLVEVYPAGSSSSPAESPPQTYPELHHQNRRGL